MEVVIKKFEKIFREVRQEMSKWETFQLRLLSEFRAASSILEKLAVIQDLKNYGALNTISGIDSFLTAKQLDSLLTIISSMKETLNDFNGVVKTIRRLQLEGSQLVKGSSNSKLSEKALRQNIGVKPSLAVCMDGLMQIHDMHHSEFLLKSSIVSAVDCMILQSKYSDLGSFEQLLIDQPNMPVDEVEAIHDIIFTEGEL